jgi:hypothetical protein
MAMYCSPVCLAKRLGPSTKAVIAGLATAVEWNGKECVLKQLHSDTGRWEVLILGSSTTLRIKPGNLQLLQHKSVWSPHHNNRAMNLALRSPEAADAAATLRLACRPFGFRRVAQHRERVMPEAEVASTFQDYAVIYFAGVGRWDREISGPDVQGLITYGLHTCVAICIADSLEKPKRCALIHSSLPLDVPSRVVEEIKWVAQATAGGFACVQVLVLKGFRYRMPFMDLLRGELRWELPDAFMLRLRKTLDLAQLQEVEVVLEHEPLFSGVAALGHNGLILPTTAATPPYKLLGHELSLHHIAARHSAMSAHMKTLSPGSRAKLDLQFDGVRHVDPTEKGLAEQFKRLRRLPFYQLDNSPLCEFDMISAIASGPT